MTAGGQPIAGLGDAAMWKFTSGSLFNSGDLELCAPKGFVSLSLNGKRDEGALKTAATTLAQKVLQRP